MTVRIGTGKDRTRALKECKSKGFAVTSTSMTDTVKDGINTVLVILKGRPFVFRYNPEYWNV